MTEEKEAKVFHALSHPYRVKILKALLSAPSENPCLGVQDLSEKLDTPFTALNRHISILYSAGIIDKERSGIAVRYTLKAKEVEPMIKQATAIAVRLCKESAQLLESIDTEG